MAYSAPMRRPLVGLALALLACRPTPVHTPLAGDLAGPGAPASAPDAWADRHLEPDLLRAHLEFLADDAQEGRAPGTPGDQRSQQHIAAAFADAGLEPAFADGYCQSFTVTDGVRPHKDQSASLTIGSASIPVQLLPFAHDSAAPVTAPLVYVGYGVEDTPELRAAIAGAIVIARAGAPDDPHIDPTRTRAQSKLIAARDRGAVGFVLWDPDSDLPFPNHGEANDLQLPAVAVGKAGTAALLAAFKVRPGKVAAAGAPSDPHRGLLAARPRRSKPAVLHILIERVTLSTCNMGARLPGSGARRIIVGAHMDHLGHGTTSSLTPGQQAIHNGADDNASGVSTMLALAAALARVPQSARPFTVEFVAFGAEEMGLLGSKHYVDQLGPDARAATIAMLNFDMVGRMQDNRLIVAGVGTSSAWSKLLEQAAGPLEIVPSEDGFGASDQASFYAAGLPVLHFFSGYHPDYHKPSDDLDKINFAGTVAIGDLTLRLIARWMRDQPTLDYLKIKAPTAPRGGFRVSLGTVPDYAAKVDGVQLADVRAGGPAAAAGLLAGDIIIRLGARDIHNFDDYMACFGELKPGVAAPIRVLRGGAPLELQITPSAPQRR